MKIEWLIIDVTSCRPPYRSRKQFLGYFLMLHGHWKFPLEPQKPHLVGSFHEYRVIEYQWMNAQINHGIGCANF